MSSNDKVHDVPPESQLITCGSCGNPVVPAGKDAIVVSSGCCSKEVQVHKKCYSLFCLAHVNNPTATNVDYRCMECEQPCFFCNTKHFFKERGMKTHV